MNRPYIKSFITLFGLGLLAGMAGCTTTASIESGEALSKRAVPGDAVVFGKLKLIRNGEEAQLGSGVFESGAKLHLVNMASGKQTIGRVGKGGEFAWALGSGNYEVVTIGFDNRGEHKQAETSFTFAVSDDHEAVYVGTIALETSFHSGYYGFNGTVDDYTVSNDCAADCAARLDRLGLSADSMDVALLQEQYQLAQRQ